jgi:hypothetical protein
MTIKKFITSFLIIGLSSGIVLGLIVTLIPVVNSTIQYFQSDSLHAQNRKDDTLRISEYYWKAVYDTIANKEYLIRGKMLDSISKTHNELIGILNLRKPICKIDYIGLDGDTIRIKILEDEYLSEQMGTSGAENYIGETIYTLTENDSIKYVRIEMNYGSHANPGLYSRNDYKNLLRE